MTGTVELNQDGTHLLIRFAYREDLVALVKELPKRRWDPRNKIWRVPIAHTEAVYTSLSRHLFEFSSEVSQLLAGTLGNTTAGDEADATPAQPGPAKAEEAGAEAMTISQLNTRVRDGLREIFPQPVWVIGEVVGFDKNAGRQHRFFQLVEKAEGQAQSQAAVETALFGGTARWLLPRLESGDDPFTLRDGIEIRAQVEVDLYPTSGRYQIVVQDIDPNHTLGKLALTREQILRELKKLDLAERNRAMPFAVPMLRIGVLTSPDSDGWTDFARHLQEAEIGLDVTLVPIKVQGAELKPGLLRGLEWFAARADEFDALCILRGGGSRTDLAGFDDRDIALAVARHPLKVMVGIGHQRDQSVLDVIAHSEKTPTAVAALLVESVRGARRDVQERALRLRDATTDLLADLRDQLATTTASLQRGTLRHLEALRYGLAGASRELQSTTLLHLAGSRRRVDHLQAQLTNATTRRLDHAVNNLKNQATRHRLLDPARVLTRGYVLARSAAGRVITSTAKVTGGDALTLQFRDGEVTSRVEQVKRESK